MSRTRLVALCGSLALSTVVLVVLLVVLGTFNVALASAPTANNNADQWETTVISIPKLVITKTVVPTANVPLDGVVTYTVVLENYGDADATGVVMTDTLPPEVDFGGWLNQGSAMLPGSDTITWGPYTATAGMDYTFSFTATLKSGTAFYAAVVTNTVEFISDNAGSGFSNDAIFTVESIHIYLPLVMRNSVGTVVFP
jgi:uncharacterized repeat protein (TIGR01451 family)